VTDQPRKTLVTGGAGFIGSHLVELLLAQGHEVIALDSLISGSTQNLEGVRDNPRFQLLAADINDAATIAPAFAGVEWVLHLAALADIVPSIQHPLVYHRANVDGTASVLEAARAAGAKRLVYAASSSCYGIPDVYPTPESAEIRPMYPYALTKNIGEQYVQHWHRTYGMETVSLRLFNVYGPRAWRCRTATRGSRRSRRSPCPVRSTARASSSPTAATAASATAPTRASCTCPLSPRPWSTRSVPATPSSR